MMDISEFISLIDGGLGSLRILISASIPPNLKKKLILLIRRGGGVVVEVMV